MFYITLATVCFAASFTVNKLYQKKYGGKAAGLFLYGVVVSFFGGVFYFCLNGFRLSFGSFSFVMAIVLAVFLTFHNFIGLVILKRCKLSLYMSFLMIGGMLIPFLYGVIFLSEKLTAMRAVAVCALLAGLIIPSFERTGEKVSKTGVLLCLCAFLCNGCISTVSKAHQINPAALGTKDFMTWTQTISLLIALTAFLVYRYIIRKKKEDAIAAEKIELTESAAKGRNTLNALALLIIISVIWSCASLFN